MASKDVFKQIGDLSLVEYKREVHEIDDPDDGVTFVNTVIKVGAQWCGPCKIAHKWMRELVEEGKLYTHVSFYSLDVDRYNADQYTDKMLSARVKTINSLPTFLIYHNNRLVKKLEGWHKDELCKAIEKYLIPLDEKVTVDNSFMAEVVKQPRERSTAEERKGEPLPEQEPFNIRKTLTDQKAILDAISK